MLRNAHQKWFFDSRSVTAAAQRKWFARLQTQTEVEFYVIWIDAEPIGMVSVTETEDAVEIGNLSLAEPYQGRGLMQAACCQLMRPDRSYRARLKPENDRSRRLFERLGFVPADECQENVLTMERTALSMKETV